VDKREGTARRRTPRGEHNIACNEALLPLLPFIKVITGTDFPANAWLQVRIEYWCTRHSVLRVSRTRNGSETTRRITDRHGELLNYARVSRAFAQDRASTLLASKARDLSSPGSLIDQPVDERQCPGDRLDGTHVSRCTRCCVCVRALSISLLNWEFACEVVRYPRCEVSEIVSARRIASRDFLTPSRSNPARHPTLAFQLDSSGSIATMTISPLTIKPIPIRRMETRARSLIGN